MALSISDHCRSCIISLQEVISILSRPNHSDNHVKPSQVCEELDRFSLFIGNIGALHRPESPLSIESRLQDANDVLTHILGLLTDLNDVTAELLDIVSGKREGMVTIADEAEEEGEVISEVSQLREEINETITRLFRVSILIRQAAPTDIFAKALSRNRYHFSDQFDIAHVGEKYRKLATDDYAWLRQRLGRAITQRRHYLSYVQDHRDKLGGISSHHDTGNGSAAKFQAPVIKQPLDSKPVLDTESRPSFFTKATTVAADRIIPQLHVAEDSDPDEDARSYTTISRSIDGDHESSANVRIPKLDTLRAGPQTEFECPFCFRIKKFKSERIWRKHVFSDLRPYVCTFPNCDAPYFGDINRWFQHEMMFHRVTYNCFLCQKLYYQEENYLSHLRLEHRETLDDGGAHVGTDLARKPLAQIPASDCPCCSDWEDRLKERTIQTTGSAPTGILAVTPTVFKRHLAAHLEQLALFAIPIGGTADDNKESNAAIEEERSRRTTLSHVSTLTFQSSPAALDDSRSGKGPSTSRGPRGLDDPDSELEISPSRMQHDLDDSGSESETNPLTHRVPRLSFATPSISSEASDQDNFLGRPIIDKRLSQLEHELEGNRAAHGDDHPDTLISMKALASYYREHEQWEEAENGFNRLMEIARERFGENHVNTVTSMRDLASCYLDQNKWSEAEVLLTRSLEINETTLGKKHPDTLDDMGGLALCLSEQGLLSEASKIYREVISANEELLGRHDGKTASYIQALATLLQKQGELGEAETLQIEVLTRFNTLYGHNHIYTLSSKEKLASVLEDQEKYQEAETLQREVVIGHERTFGRESPATLSSKRKLAAIFADQQKYQEAEALQKEVVIGYGNSFGPDDLEYLQSKQKLVFILEGQGKYEEAEASQRELLAEYEHHHGPKAAVSLSTKEQLASILEGQLKHEEAEALQREVLNGYEDTVGPERIVTMESMQRLARILESAEKLDEAGQLYRKVLEVSGKVFGSRHIRTISCIEDLASLERLRGNLDAEDSLRRDALQRYQKTLGEENPTTLSALVRVADILSRRDRFEEASVLYKKAMVSYNKLLGPDHHSTRKTTWELISILTHLGKFEEVRDLRERGVTEVRFSDVGPGSEKWPSMKIVGPALRRQGKWKELEDLYKQMFDIAMRSDENSTPVGPSMDTLAIADALASAQLKQEKLEAAESTYKQALWMLNNDLSGAWVAERLGIMYQLLEVLEKQGKYEEAVEMRSEMTAMRIHELEAENNIGLGLEGLD